MVPPPARRFRQRGHVVHVPWVSRRIGGSPSPREPVDRLLRCVLLRELLVRAWLPYELHAVELDR